jgi:hypothetical protein
LRSKQNTRHEDVMVRYLLGELDEEERIRFEAVCFDDDRQFEELLAVEAELTDDYVRGDLVGLRRERFEKQLLGNPEGQNDVEFARIITDSDANTPRAATSVINRRRPDLGHKFAWFDFHGRAFQLSLAALVLIIVGLGLWFLWSYRQTRLRGEQAVRDPAPGSIKVQESPNPAPSRPTPGEHQASTTPEPAQQPEPRIANTPPANEAPAIVSLLVVPGFDRSSGGINDLVIPPQARTARLQLALDGDNYQSYHAVLRSVEGREILARHDLKARSRRTGRTVLLELPANSIPEGDFILTLSGQTSQGEVEEVHKYFLTVSKK